MSGFVLSTQLNITLTELKSFKSRIEAGINPINVKLNVDSAQTDKLRTKIESGVNKGLGIPVLFKVGPGSTLLIKDALKAITATTPIPLKFTAAKSSVTLIKRALKDAFVSTSAKVSIPIVPDDASIKALVKRIRAGIDIGFFSKPVKIDIAASTSSLNTMRRQIIAHFFSRPVPITVTTGPITTATRTPRQSTTRQQNRFQPANNLQSVGAKIGRSIEHYGTFTTAVGTFVALFRAMQNAVDEAIKFDREMVRVSQVTGVSVVGLRDLSDEITRVSKKYGVASTEILKSAVTLAQAGLSASDTKVALDAIGATGVSATFDNINDTTEATIAIFQQFGKQASDLKEILSSINKVSGAYAVESGDITVAVRRAGGAFQAAGGNLNEFIALLTSVRQTTRESAETIATGFRTIFARLQRNSTQNFIKSLGIDLLNDKGLFVGPYEAIQKIGAALKDIESTDPRFAQIVEELGGFRQVSKVIPLLQQTAVQQRALTLAMRGGNSLSEDAEAAGQSLEVQLKKLKETFLDTVRAFANNWAIKDITNFTIEATKAILSLTKAMTPLIPLLVALGVTKLGNISGVAKGIAGHFGVGAGASGVTTGLAGAATGAAIGSSLGGTGKHAAALTLGGALALPILLEKFGLSIDKTGFALDNLISAVASSAAQIYLFTAIMKNIKLSDLGTIGAAVNNSPFGRTGSINRRYSSQVIEQEASIRGAFSRERDIAAAHYTSGPRTPTRAALNSQRIQELRDTRDSNLAIVRGRTARNAQIRYNRIQTGSLIGGAVGVAGGQLISDYGDSQIAAGRGNAGINAAGGAASGAGMGALLAASLSLGPLGIGLSAAALGAVGLATAFSDASYKIKNVEFNKDFESLADRLKKVFDNKLSPTSQAASVSDTLRKSSAAIGQLSGVDAKDALARFKNDQPGLERFFQSVAQESRTFDEFQAKTKGILSTFSALSSIPYSELETTIKKTIDLQNTLNKKIAESSEVVASELQQRVRLIALESAFNAAFASGPDLDSRIDKIFTKLEGRTSSLGGVSSQSVFSQAGEGRFGDPELVKQLARSIGSNFGGLANSQVADFSAITKLTQDLPGILVKLRSQDPLGSGDGESFIKRFEKELDGVPDSIRRTLVGSLEESIGEDGNIGKLLGEISNDTRGAAAEILKPIKHLYDTFGNFGSKLEEQSEHIVKAFSEYDEVLRSSIDVQQKSRDAGRDYNDFLLGLSGKNLTGSTLFSRRNQDLQANFGSSTVGGLADIIGNKKNQDELEGLLASRDKNKTNPKIVEQLQPRISELTRATRAASEGLHDIASDSSGYISSLKQLIVQTRSETQARSNLAKTLASGSREEKKSLSEDIFNTALALTSKVGLAAVPIDKQSGVINFLRGQGNLGVFNTGVSGSDSADKLEIDNVVRNSKGKIDKEYAERLIKNRPRSVEELLTQLNAATGEQKVAFDKIGSNLNLQSNAIVGAVGDSTREIVGVLDRIFIQNEKIKTDNEITSKKIKGDSLDEKLVATRGIGDILGVKNVGVGDIGRARELKTRADEKIRLTNQDFSLMNQVGRKFKLEFINGEETTEGLLARIESTIQESIPDFQFSRDMDRLSRGQYARKNLSDEVLLNESGKKGKASDILASTISQEFNIALKKRGDELDKLISENREGFKQAGFGRLDDEINSFIGPLTKFLETVGEIPQSEDNLKVSIDRLRNEIIRIKVEPLLRGTNGLPPAFPSLPQAFFSVPPESLESIRGLKRNVKSGLETSPAIAPITKANIEKYSNPSFNVSASASSKLKEEITKRILGGTITGKQAVAETLRANQLDRDAKRESLKIAYDAQKNAVRDKSVNTFVAGQSKRGTDKDSKYFQDLNKRADSIINRKSSGPTLKTYGSLDEEGNFIAAGSTKNQELGRETRKKLNEMRIQREYERRVNGIKTVPQGQTVISAPIAQETVEQRRKRERDTKDRFTRSQGLPQFGLTGNPLYPELPRARPGTRPGGVVGDTNNPVIAAPVTNAGTKSPVVAGQPTTVGTTPQLQDFSKLTEAFNVFNTNSNKLADAMNKFNGSKIEITGVHKVEVIINGASVLKEIMPGIREIVATESGKAIKQYAGFLTEKAGLPPYIPPEEKGGK